MPTPTILQFTQADIDELSRLLRDFRHAEAVALTQFLNEKIRAQAAERAKAEPEPNPVATEKIVNGHASEAAAAP